MIHQRALKLRTTQVHYGTVQSVLFLLYWARSDCERGICKREGKKEKEIGRREERGEREREKEKDGQNDILNQ